MPFPPSTADKSSPRRRGRLRLVWVLASLASVALAVGGCSGSGGESRLGRGDDTGSTTTTRAPLISPNSYDALRNAADPNSLLNAFGAMGTQLQALPPETLVGVAIAPMAADFLALTTKVQSSDYSVAYQVRGETVANIPGEAFVTIVHTLEVQKTAVRMGPVEAAQFQSGGEVRDCTKVAAWECKTKPAAGEAVGAEAMLLFLGLVVEQPGAFDTTTYRTEIVGVPVNCLRAEPVASAPELGVIEVCVTAEGVPLRAVMPKLTLEGVWYVPDADPAQLQAPA